MPRVGDPLPDDVRALLAAAMRPLAYQLAAGGASAQDRVAVVTAPGLDWPGAAAPHVTPAGVACGVVSRAAAEAVLAVVAPSIRPALDEPAGAGSVWCLVVWGERRREQALLVPVSPTAAPRGARGSA